MKKKIELVMCTVDRTGQDTVPPGVFSSCKDFGVKVTSNVLCDVGRGFRAPTTKLIPQLASKLRDEPNDPK